MMALLRNLTPGPFDIESKTGLVRLPGYGTVSGDFDDDYLALLEACGMVEIEALAELPAVTEQDVQQEQPAAHQQEQSAQQPPAEQKRRRGRPRRGQ